MAKTAKDKELRELSAAYLDVRNKIKPLEKEKEEISTQIKALIGDRVQVPVDGYRVSYDYDKDKHVVKFDDIALLKSKPLLYKQLVKEGYLKVEDVPGNRRLVIESLEE